MRAETIHKKLMTVGKWAGCHQIPDRSFFVGTYQFPVCARCTGVFVGQIAAIPLFFLIRPPASILVLFCGVMFLDWLLQDRKVRESTNIRRLITGLLAGYALMTIYILIIQFLISKGVK